MKRIALITSVTLAFGHAAFAAGPALNADELKTLLAKGLVVTSTDLNGGREYTARINLAADGKLNRHSANGSVCPRILTDPPYVVRYRPRNGERVTNDNNADLLKPGFAEMYRVLKPGSFCVTFYGWNKVGLFADAWAAAGFRAVGHIVFRKQHTSSVRFFEHQHEAAYLLAKGDVEYPAEPVLDVISFANTGNRLHPAQKPIESLKPLITSFCKPDGVVLDPFCGSGSSLVAAQELDRAFVGIELDARHHRTALERLSRIQSVNRHAA